MPFSMFMDTEFGEPQPRELVDYSGPNGCDPTNSGLPRRALAGLRAAKNRAAPAIAAAGDTLHLAR
jgi:hypothetical protein